MSDGGLIPTSVPPMLLSPAEHLVQDALFLRMFGAGAPGYEAQTWADWEQRAEAFLRAKWSERAA